MAGHRVVEAVDARDAIERLGRDQIDVVVSSLDLPEFGSQQLLKKLRQTPEFTHIPAVGLSDESSPVDAGPPSAPAFDELRNKKDRAAVLESVARLVHSVSEAEMVEV